MLSSRFGLLSLFLGTVGVLVNGFPLDADTSIANRETTPPTTSTEGHTCVSDPEYSDDPSKWSSREFIKANFPNPITPTQCSGAVVSMGPAL